MGAYKYGAKVPKNTVKALAIDKAAGNTLWQDAIRTEAGTLMEMETFKAMPSETKEETEGISDATATLYLRYQTGWTA
jgi:hypothetical protein